MRRRERVRGSAKEVAVYDAFCICLRHVLFPFSPHLVSCVRCGF